MRQPVPRASLGIGLNQALPVLPRLHHAHGQDKRGRQPVGLTKRGDGFFRCRSESRLDPPGTTAVRSGTAPSRQITSFRVFSESATTKLALRTERGTAAMR